VAAGPAWALAPAGSPPHRSGCACPVRRGNPRPGTPADSRAGTPLVRCKRPVGTRPTGLVRCKRGRRLSWLGPVSPDARTAAAKPAPAPGRPPGWCWRGRSAAGRAGVSPDRHQLASRREWDHRAGSQTRNPGRDPPELGRSPRPRRYPPGLVPGRESDRGRGRGRPVTLAGPRHGPRPQVARSPTQPPTPAAVAPGAPGRPGTPPGRQRLRPSAPARGSAHRINDPN
jgi:hypothetical protein